MATYDGAGQPVWYILPRAEPDAANAGTFSGPFFKTRGMPNMGVCTRCDDPALFPEHVEAVELGGASISFNADGGGTFTSPTTPPGGKTIVPEVFASSDASASEGTSAAPVRYQGLWANESEPGWGLYLAHQADVIFGVWLTYATGGNPLWYAMPLIKNAEGAYSGTIYFSTGPSYINEVYDASSVQVTEVGSATMTFDDSNTGHLEYNLTGQLPGTRDVSRLVFDTAAETSGD
jgi:hypothetical protein